MKQQKNKDDANDNVVIRASKRLKDQYEINSDNLKKILPGIETYKDYEKKETN